MNKVKQGEHVQCFAILFCRLLFVFCFRHQCFESSPTKKNGVALTPKPRSHYQKQWSRCFPSPNPLDLPKIEKHLFSLKENIHKQTRIISSDSPCRRVSTELVPTSRCLHGFGGLVVWLEGTSSGKEHWSKENSAHDCIAGAQLIGLTCRSIPKHLQWC